ncbi:MULTISPECIES: EscU/YscU/HrcU family type III secretion system export apparatus switch protein [Arthrobacter]|uniref:EscU/YscU/HrcU family type III secretion system export apparatus switch protein n=2 Tax=Arthrobacter zhangbolii TaxID=2886936 RepID=A0A9X1MA65_9MICC|nr:MULTISPECIES: EscU/YscU/HrcU family type III secretion system export apparatus switch protein [Arthrobacter]MCC3273725.1 EscU/YscU/HrcU family type III secretion system export apparatus switch protein [Arthrobacter zhangbolii]MDN3906006.1 EscU/YscU/HrcU family type III secretion system export apparatus switch protein [Arthrobacter sp. YD2]
MPEPDSGERTEQATQKRMKDVRSKGQLSRSDDLTAWVGVGATAMMMPLTISRGSSAGGEMLDGVSTITANPDPELALAIMTEGLGAMGYILGPMLGVVAAVVLLTAAVQGGIHVKKFKGKFEQFDLVKGLKRVFGTQALWNGVKSLLKTAVVGLVLYAVIQQLMPVLMSAGGLPVAAVLEAAGGGTALLLQTAVAAGLVLAAADIFVVMKRNRKKTRMTKKEVKDENKNSEGDPLIKSQRRSRQLAMSRNRMIAAVADADVVLVNPTHVAVALKYEPGKSAPRVVAKGADNIAARIREEAEKQRVPMVQDIPLARALHSACELNAEIPVELYNAVARVLAFVMSLKRRGAAYGMHTMAAAPPEPVTTPQHRKAAS